MNATQQPNHRLTTAKGNVAVVWVQRQVVRHPSGFPAARGRVLRVWAVVNGVVSVPVPGPAFTAARAVAAAGF